MLTRTRPHNASTASRALTKHIWQWNSRLQSEVFSNECQIGGTFCFGYSSLAGRQCGLRTPWRGGLRFEQTNNLEGNRNRIPLPESSRPNFSRCEGLVGQGPELDSRSGGHRHAIEKRLDEEHTQTG